MGNIYYPDMNEYRWYVRYDNVLADNTVLTRLNATQIDLLMLIFWHLKNRGTERIALKFSQLRKESGHNSIGNVKLATDLDSFKDLDYNSRFTDIPKYRTTPVLPVFSYFHADAASGIFQCEVSKKCESCFSSSNKKEYIGFYYGDLLHMKYKYTKRLFLFLQRFQKLDATSIRPSEFKQALGIPSSWGHKKIEERILEPADYEFQENSRHMDLIIRVMPTISNGAISTSNRVMYYDFTFDFPDGHILEHSYPASHNENAGKLHDELVTMSHATGKRLLTKDSVSDEKKDNL